MLIGENRWRAQRYWIHEVLVNFSIGEVVPVKNLVTKIIELVLDDAQKLGCEGKFEHLKTILSRGTSAHLQTAIFDVAISTGADKQSTFNASLRF